MRLKNLRMHCWYALLVIFSKKHLQNSILKVIGTFICQFDNRMYRKIGKYTPLCSNTAPG